MAYTFLMNNFAHDRHGNEYVFFSGRTLTSHGETREEEAFLAVNPALEDASKLSFIANCEWAGAPNGYGLDRREVVALNEALSRWLHNESIPARSDPMWTEAATDEEIAMILRNLCGCVACLDRVRLINRLKQVEAFLTGAMAGRKAELRMPLGEPLKLKPDTNAQPIIAEIHNEGTIAIETSHPLHALLEKCVDGSTVTWDEMLAVESQIANSWPDGRGFTFAVVNVETQADRDQTFAVYRLRAVNSSPPS